MVSGSKERLHSLDALRAIMMILGLAIHTAISYRIKADPVWPVKDPSAIHISNDFIVSFIHAFRMQTFFFMAGFFGALLFYEWDFTRMVKNRIARIIFPFIVFLPLLFFPVRLFMKFSENIFAGSSAPLAEAMSNFQSFSDFIPEKTMHLWFLYYLIMLTFTAVCLGLIFKRIRSLSGKIIKAFNYIIQKPLVRLLIFGCVSAITYIIMGKTQVATSTSFVPDFDTYLYYVPFYLSGWLLFKAKKYLDTLKKYDWVSAVAGIVLFSYYFFNYDKHELPVQIAMKSIMVWLFIFGLTGLFIRYASGHSNTMRYISDSSYWVYLIHLPFAALIPGLIADWPLNATLKFLADLIIIGLISFVSYHYLVRHTFIGQFLNGRRGGSK